MYEGLIFGEWVVHQIVGHKAYFRHKFQIYRWSYVFVKNLKLIFWGVLVKMGNDFQNLT